jgi:hypothetical protein
MPFLGNHTYRNRIEWPASANFRELCKPTAITTSYDLLTNSDLYKFRFKDRVNYWTNSEKLTDSNNRHSGGRKSKLVRFEQWGSLAVIRKCCYLWRALFCFVCASTYFSLLHLLLRTSTMQPIKFHLQMCKHSFLGTKLDS